MKCRRNYKSIALLTPCLINFEGIKNSRNDEYSIHRTDSKSTLNFTEVKSIPPPSFLSR